MITILWWVIGIYLGLGVLISFGCFLSSRAFKQMDTQEQNRVLDHMLERVGSDKTREEARELMNNIPTEMYVRIIFCWPKATQLI